MTLDPHSAEGNPADEIANRSVGRMSGRTFPNRMIEVGPSHGGHFGEFVRSEHSGRFTMVMRLHPGANAMTIKVVGMRRFAAMTMNLVYEPIAFARSFSGSPTPANSPFTRIIPNSQAYGPTAAPRPDATTISLQMAEDPNNPSFSSPKIELGLVFFGQFVDHDLNFNTTGSGQGASVDPIDRWGRSLKELVTTLEELSELGVGFVALTEALDLTTSTGRVMADPSATRAGTTPGRPRDTAISSRIACGITGGAGQSVPPFHGLEVGPAPGGSEAARSCSRPRVGGRPGGMPP
jgi:hypothetical protein